MLSIYLRLKKFKFKIIWFEDLKDEIEIIKCVEELSVQAFAVCKSELNAQKTSLCGREQSVILNFCSSVHRIFHFACSLSSPFKFNSFRVKSMKRFFIMWLKEHCFEEEEILEFVSYSIISSFIFSLLHLLSLSSKLNLHRNITCDCLQLSRVFCHGVQQTWRQGSISWFSYHRGTATFEDMSIA